MRIGRWRTAENAEDAEKAQRRGREIRG